MRDIWGAPGLQIPHYVMSQHQIWPNLCARYHTLLILCLVPSCHPFKILHPSSPAHVSPTAIVTSLLGNLFSSTSSVSNPASFPDLKPYRHTPESWLGYLPTLQPQPHVLALKSSPCCPTTNQPNFSLLSRTDHLNPLCSPHACVRLIPAPGVSDCHSCRLRRSPCHRHALQLLRAFSFLHGHCTPSPHAPSSDPSGPRFLWGGRRVYCISGE